MGCTPELLCHIQKQNHTYSLFSEALAGTIIRGSNDFEDRAFEEQLKTSQKDRQEHQIVVDGITEVLESYCSEIHCESHPNIKKQQHVQHLQTRITAEVSQSNSDNLEKLILELHPTPAVCGYPKTAALDVLMKIEQFDRGLYAGAIGIISHLEITLCVGIRSALYYKNQYWLWGGAGLVQNSQAKKEYQEMNNKMKGFEMILQPHKTMKDSNSDQKQDRSSDLSEEKTIFLHRYTI